MAKIHKIREPRILFGEGPTEGMFLERLKQEYSQELADKLIVVKHGSGGSPGSVLLELKKKYLDVSHAHTPALVLIDADKGLDDDAKAILEEHSNIEVIFSKPQCLEGLLLDLLDDLPSKGQQTSDNLKKVFQKQYLGGGQSVRKHFKQKRETLFPRDLLEMHKAAHPVLKEIYKFLGLP